MPRCARETCGRWRPDLLARRGVAGLAFDGVWFCSAACLEQTMRDRLVAMPDGPAEPRRVRPRIGVLLASLGVLRPDEIAMALETQKSSGRRLGEEVRHLGLASELDVLRALATQERVRYLAAIDQVPLAVAPGGLSADTVRALGVVPIGGSVTKRRLHVACAAPVPRLALAAMASLTEWVIEPFLVSDERLTHLVRAYALGPGSGRARGSLCGVEDAAAHITRAAADGRADRLAHARCDRHVWIRLDGCAGHEDLLLPVGSRTEEPCPAAPISH